MKKNVIDLISRAPNTPGVYLMKDAQNRVLYVGKALRLRDRLKAYISPDRDSRPSILRLVPQIVDIEWLVTDNEKEALLLENNLIKSHRPRYNITLKDDRSYVSLKLTKHDFPRLFVTRKIVQDGGQYFGPYASSGDVRRTLKLVQKIFLVRDCSDAFYNQRKRPCLQYQIRRCSAPCVKYIDQASYEKNLSNVKLFLSGHTDELVQKLNQDMKEAAEKLDYELAAALRDRVRSIESTLEAQKVESRQDDRDADVIGAFGDASATLVKILHVRRGRLVGSDEHFLAEPFTALGEIFRAALRSYYLSEDRAAPPNQLILGLSLQDSESFEALLSEKYRKNVKILTPKRGLPYRLLKLAEKNAESSFEERKRKSLLNHELLADLQRQFKLNHFPRHIEGYDISSFHGASPIGSKVVFIDGEPDKRQYRAYKIQNIKGSNDFGMLREMFVRRFQKILQGDKRPDLILVDGGKGQLAQAVEVLHELNIQGIDVMSMAKEKQLKSRSGKTYAPERVFCPGRKDSIVLPASSKILHLLMRVRDEAHRFGITRHRRGRNKSTLESVLRRIPGIGHARQKDLLRHFGSLEGIRRAELEHLEKVPGMHQKAARAVYDFFRTARSEEE